MKTEFLSIVIILLTFTLATKAQPVTLTASPNPFSSSTDLTIHNLSNDTITLKIYSITGQVVTQFFDSIVLSGTITVTFNADTLQDGIYIASLTKNGYNYALKVLKSQSIVGINNPKIDLNSIDLYPNPIVDKLTISTNLEIVGFALYDLQGRQLMTSSIQPKTIDFKKFDQGPYLLYLKTENEMYIQKIIKK